MQPTAQSVLDALRLMPHVDMISRVKWDAALLTDRTDTEAMLEADRCAGVPPVPVKTTEPQALQALHRVRTQWQATRTARINVIRGILREHGYPIPVGARTVLVRIATIRDDPTRALPAVLHQTVTALVDEVRALEARVAMIDRELARVARVQPAAARLQQIPGVGVVTATALVGRSATSTPFAAAGTSRAGWGSRHGNPPRAPAGISGASVNGETVICGAC